MVETLMYVVSQVVLFVVVLGIGVEALVCDARNPLPKFDNQETIRFKDVKIEKTRMICLKSI